MNSWYVPEAQRSGGAQAPAPQAPQQSRHDVAFAGANSYAASQSFNLSPVRFISLNERTNFKYSSRIINFRRILPLAQRSRICSSTAMVSPIFPRPTYIPSIHHLQALRMPALQLRLRTRIIPMVTTKILRMAAILRRLAVHLTAAIPHLSMLLLTAATPHPHPPPRASAHSS